MYWKENGGEEGGKEGNEWKEEETVFFILDFILQIE